MPVKHDKRHYRRRNRIKIMFGRLKDWCRVATRYNRCPTVFFSAIALAATVLFRLKAMSPDLNNSMSFARQTNIIFVLSRILATQLWHDGPRRKTRLH